MNEGTRITVDVEGGNFVLNIHEDGEITKRLRMTFALGLELSLILTRIYRRELHAAFHRALAEAQPEQQLPSNPSWIDELEKELNHNEIEGAEE